MNDDLRKKLDELYLLLDNLPCIKNLESIKKNIPSSLITLINNYQNNQTVSNKKIIYENEIFKKYIENESVLNRLIMEMNNKFKISRSSCANN